MTKISSEIYDYGLMESLGDGGAFYLDGTRTKLTVTGLDSTNQLKISDVKSGSNGGLIYSKGILGITMRDINLMNSEAALDGGVLYLNENQPTTIERVDTN